METERKLIRYELNAISNKAREIIDINKNQSDDDFKREAINNHARTIEMMIDRLERSIRKEI